MIKSLFPVESHVEEDRASASKALRIALLETLLRQEAAIKANGSLRHYTKPPEKPGRSADIIQES